MYAINPNGSKKWEFWTGNYIKSSPIIDADGTIYFGSDNNKLYAIKPDGTRKWEFATEGRISSSPAIGADGTIYVGSEDGKLYAFNYNPQTIYSASGRVITGSGTAIPDVTITFSKVSGIGTIPTTVKTDTNGLH